MNLTFLSQMLVAFSGGDKYPTVEELKVLAGVGIVIAIVAVLVVLLLVALVISIAIKFLGRFSPIPNKLNTNVIKSAGLNDEVSPVSVEDKGAESIWPIAAMILGVIVIFAGLGWVIYG